MPQSRATRTPKPAYALGDEVVSRGEPYVVVAVHRKRPGKDRTYEVRRSSGAHGGIVRERDLAPRNPEE